MRKSLLLTAIQKEIQRHDLSYFVDEPPSVAQGERRSSVGLPDLQEKNQHDWPILGPSDERCDAGID